MSKSSIAVLLGFAIALGWALPVLAQKKPEETREPVGGVTYESVAPGMLGARIFTTDVLRDVFTEVKDFILGPGKSAPEVPTTGFAIVELKSGEVETMIDDQTVRRRPGDYWVVRPGTRYAIKNLDGLVVLHSFIFTRK